METVFRVGMTVYDEVFQKGRKGEIVEIAVWDRKYLGDMKVLIVQFGCSSYTYSIRGALLAFGGLKLNYVMPVTLSTSPYTIGEIKQEPAPPTLYDAANWCKENHKYYKENICGKYVNDEYEDAFEALNSLIILRELYNEGWVPDWCNDRELKWTIEFARGRIMVTNEVTFSRPLYFKTEEIAKKFFEDHNDLITQAKLLI